MDSSTEYSGDSTILIVCIVCHDSNLQKESEFISNEVLPRLWLWCQSQQVKLIVSHCKLKEDIVREVINDLKSLYVNSARPRNYLSFVVNLMSELQVEAIPAIGDVGEEFTQELCGRDASAYSLFLLFRNICSSCFPGEFNNCETMFKHSVQSSQILHITRQCHYCEEPSDLSETPINFSFCEKFLDFLQSHISLKLNSNSLSIDDVAETDELSSLQLSCINNAASCLNPVKEIVNKIDAVITESETDVPVLVLGEPGMFKTSVMAASVLRVIERELNSEPCREDQMKIFYHFAGLAPKSVELDIFLGRLVKEFNLLEDSAASLDICSTVQLCNVALSNPSSLPIVIFVDSVDLLDDVVNGQKVKWIPSKLAPRIRLVLSTTIGSTQHLALRERTHPPIEIFIPALPIPSQMCLVGDGLGDVFPFTLGEMVPKLTNSDAAGNPAWIEAVSYLLSLSAKTASILGTDVEHLQRKVETVISQNLEKIWEDILSCLEQLLFRDHVICILSLVTSSAAGLRRSELFDLLNSHPLVPPSPFEEKADAEEPEKVTPCSQSVSPQLTADRLNEILQELRPCTLRLFDGVEDRFYVRHEALKNAIKNRYFVYKDANYKSNEESDSLDLSCFWHQKLANYFQTIPDGNRKFEEYLYQLCCLEDSDGLAEYLTRWSVFDRLYTDEHSTILLSYWKKAGGTSEMILRYKLVLAKLETDRVDINTLAVRHEQVARLFILTGKYAESLELAKRALKWEEKELGRRPERMVEVYGLLTDIYDEKLKLQDFISPSQIPDLRRTISYGRKSIDLRRQFATRYHKFKLGISLMKLAFSLESWASCGGDDTLATSTALTEGQGHANKAIEIFKTLNDQGHYAEALMTKGVLSPRGTPEQLRLYHEALDICQEVNGEYHILTSRIYINIGIVYEDSKDYVKAYKYFAKWARVNEVVLGPSHPKTMRAMRVLKEPRNMYIASRLKDLERLVDEGDRENVLNEDTINAKARQFDELTQERSDEGNSDGEEEHDAEEPDVLDMMRPTHNTLFSLASELRRTIEEMLQHAMRESQDDELRTLFTDNRVTDQVAELELSSVSSSDLCMFDSDNDSNTNDNEADNGNVDNGVL